MAKIEELALQWNGLEERVKICEVKVNGCNALANTLIKNTDEIGQRLLDVENALAQLQDKYKQFEYTNALKLTNLDSRLMLLDVKLDDSKKKVIR